MQYCWPIYLTSLVLSLSLSLPPQVLAAVHVQPPRIPVLSNVSHKPFPNDGQAIRELLARQLVEPVQVKSLALIWCSSQASQLVGPRGLVLVVLIIVWLDALSIIQG